VSARATDTIGRVSVSSPNQLTIEQLAAQSGMSVRNIRAHQARGLLAPPEVRLRVVYYGPEHVARPQLIRDLQDEGPNLNGIKRLLEQSNGTAERLLRFREALAAPERRDADARRARQALSRQRRGGAAGAGEG
jgi:DNA-binding transcriptional MerR regulator